MNLILSNLIGTLRATFKIGSKVTLDTAAVTTPKTLTFPDKNGTIATTSDSLELTGDVTGLGTSPITVTLSSSGASAGTYTNANVTVDSKGRVTSITSGSSGSGGVVSTTNETPTGSINGSNKIFALTNSAANNEVVVTINGLKQEETADYSVSGTTLTFVDAPPTGATVQCFYVNSTSAAGYQVSTKSANYTLVNTDYVVLANTASQNITLTLPTAVGQSGRQFTCKKVSYSNSMIIATTSSQTIDGDLTQTITPGSKGAITVHSDGANWYII